MIIFIYSFILGQPKQAPKDSQKPPQSALNKNQYTPPPWLSSTHV